MAKTSDKALWIWYPGDFEIWLGNIFNNRRTERGAMFPPFWKQDSHWPCVEFLRRVELDRPETIHIWAEGRFSLKIDDKLQFGEPASYTLPAGKHSVSIKVWNQATPPALFIQSESLPTDARWTVTYEDKIWIDENGVAHGSGIYLKPGSWDFDSPEARPSLFRLTCEPRKAVSCENVGNGGRSILVDFGKETFGYLVLRGVKGRGQVDVFYGESRAEAMDREYCETLDRFEVGEGDFTAPDSKAFRYVMVDLPEGLGVGEISMLYEYLPQDVSRSGSFECSDPEVNEIWKVGAYTMDLTTREFMMDGIKRDRWTWSGDAIQSYLMNYYLRFDSATVKRTIRQLRGKGPVTSHVNTILDYTFYWFNSIYDYYLYTGDIEFIHEMYPKMEELMEYVLGRLDANSFATGCSDDWVFVDWVDFPMHKRGSLCFEQLLFIKSLETMDICRKLAGKEGGPDYGGLARKVLSRVRKTFWSPEAHAFMHALEPELNPQVTKFPNMFAILYGYVGKKRRQEILRHVMHNPAVPEINTPYMRFYELEALCRCGLQDEVMETIRSYWGGMLKEGATSFWEKYNPEMHGDEHLTMYGRPYGKSLCHAWGASPIYLLGRYFLGVEPLSPGYRTWQVKPSRGDLEWIKGDVPTPFGKIHVEMDGSHVSVTAPEGIGEGVLIAGGRKVPVKPGETTSIRT